jgi:hypothetical protein
MSTWRTEDTRVDAVEVLLVLVLANSHHTRESVQMADTMKPELDLQIHGGQIAVLVYHRTRRVYLLEIDLVPGEFGDISKAIHASSYLVSS